MLAYNDVLLVPTLQGLEGYRVEKRESIKNVTGNHFQVHLVFWDFLKQ